MRRMFLVLIVLAFAMPAMAAVLITATDEGGGIVRIDYITDANVSAFALEISFDSNATIVDVNNYHLGESTTSSKGYGIFLDKINGIKINNQGQVTSDGNPIAHKNAPDANGTGLGTGKVILEMGALYEEGNQPALSGTLCKIRYELLSFWFETPPTTTMTIVGNATRGNIVLENASAAAHNLPQTLAGLPDTGLATCIVQGHMTPDYSVTGLDWGGGPAYSDYNDWVAVDQPGCWCVGNDPNANARQCWGDADTHSQGNKNFWVFTEDLNVLLAGWKKKYVNMAGQTYPGLFGPVPWICADFDHFGQGTKKFRVFTNDLNILLAGWKQKNLPSLTCP